MQRRDAAVFPATAVEKVFFKGESPDIRFGP